MSFGINGSDPFKSYSSNADAGGKMGVFAKRKRKDEKGEKDKKEENFLEISDDQDEDNLELDMDDIDFLD